MVQETYTPEPSYVRPVIQDANIYVTSSPPRNKYKLISLEGRPDVRIGRKEVLRANFNKKKYGLQDFTQVNPEIMDGEKKVLVRRADSRNLSK